MNDYQREQLDTLRIVQHGLAQMGGVRRHQLRARVGDYLRFRQSVDAYLKRYFSHVCTRTCYLSRTSACCAKDSIIIFFADMVVNALVAAPDAAQRMQTLLHRVNPGHRCVYLTESGCVWSLRPVVCAMFLCDRAMQTVFDTDPGAKVGWDALRRQEKAFKWPDRPVLFDHLEHVFMDLGYRSTLMHLNYSPGLLRVKMKAGLIENKVARSSRATR